jgi:membrane dipeptidase
LHAIEESDKLVMVTKSDQILKNHSDKISVILGFEGGEAIDEDLRILNVFYRLGLRRLTLCWNNRNAIGSGMTDQRSKGGLTDFGLSVVEECNKLGILVDVSHIADASFWDVMDASKDPIIASHSNCRSLCLHMRNLTDDMTKALAEKGGVQGVNYASHMLSKKSDEATVETVVDHIDRIVELTGNANHVGLGSDFDGVPATVKGLEDVSKVPNLTRTLMSRGYSDQDITKILGGNFLRVIEKVWK